MQLTRREYLLAAACWQSVLKAQGLATFDAKTAAEIEAICAQIIPDDGTPGARETGVIRFIDRVLAGYEIDKRGAYQQGLRETQATREKLFPESTGIAALAPADQKKLVEAIEKTPFFGLVRMHAILGFLCHPKHGGNEGQAGWKLIGFTNSMHYAPPFGYYDTPGNEPR